MQLVYNLQFAPACALQLCLKCPKSLWSGSYGVGFASLWGPGESSTVNVESSQFKGVQAGAMPILHSHISYHTCINNTYCNNIESWNVNGVPTLAKVIFRCYVCLLNQCKVRRGCASYMQNSVYCIAFSLLWWITHVQRQWIRKMQIHKPQLCPCNKN